MISLALFGHHQSLNKPMDEPYPATSVVEVVLGLLNTQDGVNLFFFAPPHYADNSAGLWVVRFEGGKEGHVSSNNPMDIAS